MFVFVFVVKCKFRFTLAPASSPFKHVTIAVAVGCLDWLC